MLPCIFVFVLVAVAPFRSIGVLHVGAEDHVHPSNIFFRQQELRTSVIDSDDTEKPKIALNSSSGTIPVYPYSHLVRDSNGLEGSLWEGDIMLSREEALKHLGNETVADLEMKGFVFRRKVGERYLGIEGDAAGGGSSLWKERSEEGRLLVPYVLVDALTDAETDIIFDGMKLVEDTGVVTFVQRTAELEYIEIGGGIDSSGCFSNAIGLLTGPFNNYINIGNGYGFTRNGGSLYPIWVE